MATIAVKDIQAAKKFYEGALGLKLATTGAGSARVPERELEESWCTSHATPGRTKRRGNLGIEDGMERVVQALRRKGVTFEH